MSQKPAEFDLEERAAIIADGCRVSQERALEIALAQLAAEERASKGNRSWEQKRLV